MSDDPRPEPAGTNAEEGDFGAPILHLDAWCGRCAETLGVHLGLDARPCRCGASLVEIVAGGQRWRRAGAARDLGAILGRRPEDAPRDGARVVGWFAGVRTVADARWRGGRWWLKDGDGWRPIDAALVAWLPTSLDAATDEAP